MNRLTILDCSWKALFVLGLSLFWACQNRSVDKEQAQQDQAAGTDSGIPAEEKTLSLPYVATIDSTTQKLNMMQNPQRSAVPLNKEELAEALNLKYPDIQLQLGPVYQDTLTVRIPEATSLTQKYGTTGALTYLAETTYAFTDLPGIQVVNFDFKEGDHAVPGPYTRESFKDGL